MPTPQTPELAALATLAAARNYLRLPTTKSQWDEVGVINSLTDYADHANINDSIITATAIRQVMADYDPDGYALFAAQVKPIHWDLFALAMTLPRLYRCDTSYLTYFDAMLEMEARPCATELREWFARFYFLMSSFCGSLPYRSTFNLYQGLVPQSVLMADNIQYLYEANTLVAHLERLFGMDDSVENLLKQCGVDDHVIEELNCLYGTLRPAADLWRELPWEAIAPFERLRPARALLEAIDPVLINELDRHVRDYGALIEGSLTDIDQQAADWWCRWTDENEYEVQRTVTPFDSLACLNSLHRTNHAAACAFDPGNPDNSTVLRRIEANASAAYDMDVEINQQAAHHALTTYNQFLENVLSTLANAKPEMDIPPMARSIVPAIAWELEPEPQLL